MYRDGARPRRTQPRRGRSTGTRAGWGRPGAITAAVAVECRGPRSDRAIPAKLRDLGRGVAELAEDLIGVLAEQGWSATHRAGSLGETDRNPWRAHPAGDGMIDLRDEAEVAHDRIVEYLGEVVDRPDRHVRLAQLADHVALGHGVDARGDQRDQRLTMLHATCVVGEPPVVEEILEVDSPAQPLEECVVGAAEVHEPIGPPERLIA